MSAPCCSKLRAAFFMVTSTRMSLGFNIFRYNMTSAVFSGLHSSINTPDFASLMDLVWMSSRHGPFFVVVIRLAADGNVLVYVPEPMYCHMYDFDVSASDANALMGFGFGSILGTRPSSSFVLRPWLPSSVLGHHSRSDPGELADIGRLKKT